MRALLVLLLLAPLAVAQPGCQPHECIQVIPPLDIPIIQGDVVVREVELDIEVVDGIATVRQRIVVENTGTTATELVANLPLAPTAAVLAFNLTVGDAVFEGVVKERAAAQAEYDEAKNESRDALLLWRDDPRALRLSANVAPGEPRTLQIASVALAPNVAGARVLRVPTSLLPEADVVDVSVSLRDRFGMEDVAFPEAALTTTVNTPQHVEASLQASGAIDDVVAVWREDTREWDVRVLASHDGADAAVLVRIDHHPLGGAVLSRDVAFVLDHSGSMGGHKIVDARNAVATGLGMLRPDDRFALHIFDDVVDELTNGLSGHQRVPAMQGAVREVAAEGSTDLHGGLMAGLESLPEDAERVAAVILFSDGLPTSGVRNHDRILADAVEASGGAAVHVVAIGVDADRTFLQDVAERTGGTLTILEPGEGDLEGRLEQLLAELDRPVARDVRVTFSGFEATGVMPDPIPIMYEGRTTTLLLRGDLPEAWSMRLRATGAGGAVDRLINVSAQDVQIVPAVERLWGAAHVESLLAIERVEGTSEDLRQQIIDAAVAHGVVTPYTAWVAVGPPSEDGAIGSMLRDRAGGAAGGGGGVGANDEPGTPGLAAGLAAVALLGLAAMCRRSPPF